jgi:hypothetical protein
MKGLKSVKTLETLNRDTVTSVEVEFDALQITDQGRASQETRGSPGLTTEQGAPPYAWLPV